MNESKIGLVPIVGGVVMMFSGILYSVFGFVLIGGMCTVSGACIYVLDKAKKKEVKK